MLNGKAIVTVSVFLSSVYLNKYSFKDMESTVIKTLFEVPPISYPFAFSTPSCMSGLITAFFIGVSYSMVFLFLNPLFSFGRHTTVRKEHQIMFSGKRK